MPLCCCVVVLCFVVCVVLCCVALCSLIYGFTEAKSKIEKRDRSKTMEAGQELKGEAQVEACKINE